MKKILLVIGFVGIMVAAAYAESHVTINTSCGVSVDMIYQDHHTGADVVHDALILEQIFCGD